MGEAVEDMFSDLLPATCFVPGILDGGGIGIDHDDAAGKASFPGDVREVRYEVGGLDSSKDGELRVWDAYTFCWAISASL